MTKATALKIFKEEAGKFIHNGSLDKTARAEAWNNYTDRLCKDGFITLSQYNSWTNPF